MATLQLDGDNFSFAGFRFLRTPSGCIMLPRGGAPREAGRFTLRLQGADGPEEILAWYDKTARTWYLRHALVLDGIEGTMRSFLATVAVPDDGVPSLVSERINPPIDWRMIAGYAGAALTGALAVLLLLR